MDFDFMETNETSLDLFNYSLRIMGESGVGKTSLFHSLCEGFKKETGNKNIGILLPLELGYSSLQGLNIFKLKDKKTGVKKPILSNWEDVIEAVDQLVKAKMKDPEFPIKIVGIDTTTRLEKYGMKEIEKIHFRETGVNAPFNACWKGYGVPHNKLKTMVMELIIDRLRAAGFIPYYISHSRQKQKKTRTTGEEYMFVGSDTGEGFDSVFLQDCDFSLVYALKRTIVNKQEIVGGRTIKLRNDDEFKGAKARFSNVPDEFVCGTNAKQTADIFIDIFKKAVKFESGIEDDSIIEEKKVEQIKKHDSLIISNIESMKELEQEDKDNIEREKFIDHIQPLYMQLPTEWIEYINGLVASQKATDYIELIKNGDIEVVKGLATAIGFTWSN